MIHMGMNVLWLHHMGTDNTRCKSKDLPCTGENTH